MVNHIKNFFLGSIISGLFYILSFVIILITQIPAYVFGYAVWFVLMAVIMGTADILSYDLLLDKFSGKIKVLLFYDFHGDDNCDHVFLLPFFLQLICISGGIAVSIIWRRIQKRRTEAK